MLYTWLKRVVPIAPGVLISTTVYVAIILMFSNQPDGAGVVHSTAEVAKFCGVWLVGGWLVWAGVGIYNNQVAIQQWLETKRQASLPKSDPEFVEAQREIDRLLKEL